MLRTLFAGLLFLAAAMAAPLYAQTPAAKPVRVLFIGNSLTTAGDIPGRLGKVAKAMGKLVAIESVAFPGYSLEDHWRGGPALEALRKGWDVVILQQGASAGEASRQQLIESAKKFALPIREAGAKPALFMVWPPSDRLKEFTAVIESYRAAAQAIDAMILPVGEAWLRALANEPRLRLYADLNHPSLLGSDLAVLTIYLSIFPAGAQEFNDEYVEKIARVLEISGSQRDFLFDMATHAIDEPLAIK